VFFVGMLFASFLRALQGVSQEEGKMRSIKKALVQSPVALLVALVAMLATSCESNKRVPVFPVSGQVLFGGKPIPRALLVFHPAGESSLRPLGAAEEDGSFTLSTYDDGDGAPVGEYIVTVEWRRLATIDDDKPPPNLLPAKYTNPKTSGLTARITEGDNVLPPIQLTR
jgi:hypothetical protein